MGCKIKRDYTLDQGKKNYLMLTADFGSLQMRLTTADTAMNPSTKNLEQPCDPGLYSIYNRNTECSDAHSNTLKIVFIDSINGQLYIFKMDDGSEIKLYQDTDVSYQSSKKITQDLAVGDILEGKVIKEISHRSPTTKEVKSFTKDGYVDKYKDKRFTGWRRASKTVNFATLFGAGAQTLAHQLEDSGYKESEADDYIDLTNNVPLYNNLLAKNLGKMEPKKVKYLTAATLMLESYYKGFPGVQERSKREADFAWAHGYSRCWNGPVRQLPELRYMKRNREGNVIGADQLMWSGKVSNLKNEAGNSPIQCMESNIAIKNIIWLNKYLRRWNLKTVQYNMVHDSVDLLIFKPELNLVCSLLNATSTWVRNPHFGIDMCMDFTICDPSKGFEKNMYHAGLENPFKIDPIEVAVEKWNKEHERVEGFQSIEWTGCEDCGTIPTR